MTEHSQASALGDGLADPVLGDPVLADPVLADPVVADDTAPLLDLVRLAVTGVAGCTSAGITMLGSAGRATVASDSARARGVDHAQYEAGDGPCLEAIRRGDI